MTGGETTTEASSYAPSKAWKVADWTLRSLLALAFIAAAGAKLSGAAPMVAIFDDGGR